MNDKIKAIAAYLVGGTAALVVSILLHGCSTIRDAVDEYRNWAIDKARFGQ